MIERVLLADDDSRDVEIALDVIARAGRTIEVIVTEDGNEALAYLRRKGKYRLRPGGLPTLILLDVKMPKLDGFEVLRQLRADPDLWGIPVVMLTASRQEKDLMAAFELEADGYLMKPLAMQAFEAAVNVARASAAARRARVNGTDPAGQSNQS